MSITSTQSEQASDDDGRFAGATDVGTVREANEDSFHIDSGRGIAIVADGMGGHRGGKMASEIAISRIMASIAATDSRVTASDDTQILSDPDATNPNVMPDEMPILFEAIVQANREIFQQNQAHGAPDGQGMGTTVTGIWQRSSSGPLIVFNVGDSRVYRFRGGQLVQLTHDDSLAQYIRDSGLSDENTNKNVLVKAVGPAAELEPSVQQFAAQDGDYYLLCSDGLHGSVDDGAIAEMLRQAYTSELSLVCKHLIARAIEAGSRDNITAVLVALS